MIDKSHRTWNRTDAYMPDTPRLTTCFALTFLTTIEIQHVHQKFMQLAGEVTDFKTQVITSAQVSSIPAIQVNPFKDQICKVFSWNKEGLFSFDEFLEMMSVFSENASLSVKADYAFRIYDLNGNDYIDQEDIRNIILRLTYGMMDETNISVLIHYILDEGDLNNDGMLSFSEFKNVIERSPDFQKSFTIRF
ncbi:calcium and integrin-binding family member 4-like [Scyliorhinus torazame]|uniref:calcium and integrin-binding family member 4-like n=1 Tax=Scyliorhinus torazame TaxID=75743 RepID=UPI003B5BF032